MKLKKLLFLPLGLLALAGCTPTTQLTKEVANTKLAEAAEKMMTTDMTSIEAKLDASLELEITQFEEVVTDPLMVGTINADLSVNAKAKNLDKETAEFAITAEGSLAVAENSETMIDVNGDIGLYYVDEFAYLGFNLAALDGESNTEQTMSAKQKMEVGPFPGLPPTDEVLPEEMDFTELTTMLNEIRNVTATDKGGVILITYKVTQQDAIDMFAEFAISLQASIIGRELTSEEVTAIRAMAEEEVNNMLTLRKAEVVTEINKAGFLSKLEILLDADLYTPSSIYDYDTDTYLEVTNRISVNVDIGFSLKMNEPVSITYPSFAAYELVEEFGLPGMIG